MARLTVNGIEMEAKDGSSILEAIVDSDNKPLLQGAVAARVEGKLIVDLRSPADGASGDVELVSIDSPEGTEICRHSTSHVLAEAVKSLFPDVKVAIGPTIEDGFYYDFDIKEPFTPEDLKKIEKRMKELIKAKSPITREEISKADALKLFSDMGESYKVELIEELEEGTISIYRQGEGGFVDLCRGPHLPSTGSIKAFKLTSSAGAYWRGSEKNKMLQRIYGTAFATKDKLKEHLARLEEAKKRDHRKLGKELDLFSTSEDIGAGLALWHPKGSAIRSSIENFWRSEHEKNDYGIVYTPHIALTELWKKSGHWDFYQESLFSPMDVDGRDYIVKPMNCPFHIEIYKSKLRSYRELPVRYAELGTVYRYERSGVLHGLLRVRGFTQDDAHIFMRPEQLEEEITGVLNFTLYILRSFGFNEFDVYLSTRPEKFVGSLDNWGEAEGALKAALENSGLPYELGSGRRGFLRPEDRY